MNQTKHIVAAVLGVIVGFVAAFVVTGSVGGIVLAPVLGAGAYLVSRFGCYSQLLVCLSALGAVCAGIAGTARLADDVSETDTAGAILVGVCIAVLLAIAVIIELVYRKSGAANKADAGDA